MNEMRLNTVTIIPNDNILDVPTYYNESYTLHHYKLATAFSLKYNLPFIGENADMELPNDGHILIKSWDNGDLAICYLKLPITTRQYNELLALKSFLSSFSYFQCRSINCNDFNIYSKNSTDKTVVDKFLEELSNHIESRRVK